MSHQPPLLFGSARTQELLLKIFRDGQIAAPTRLHIPSGLRRAGLVARVGPDRSKVLVIPHRYPAIDELRTVLAELSGGYLGHAPRLGQRSIAELSIDWRRPLGHESPYCFRILLHIVRAGVVATESLRWRMPDVRPPEIAKTVGCLVAAGAIVRHGPSLSIAPNVPIGFLDLVMRLGEVLAPRDPRLQTSSELIPRRPVAFQKASDNAPRLFGPDIRLRNLMALARHGALYASDLRQLTGVSTQRLEGEDSAPFGRGNIVLVRPGREGIIVELHPAFPLVFPLRRLLLKLEEQYSLPSFDVAHPRPASSKRFAWQGDKLSLFGGAIATRILMTIGVLGWTFEALCVSAAVGYDRVVVKRVLKALHEDGILQSDRAPRPGFNVRIVRVAESFAAKDELLMLLRTAIGIWPEFESRTKVALDAMSPRTKAHLCRQGILLPAAHGLSRAMESEAERKRQECLSRYFALSTGEVRVISSTELMLLDSNLYRSIISCWKTFASFRQDAGLPQVLSGKTRSPSKELRADCIREYFQLAESLGSLPNTAQISRTHGWLYQRICIQWGGFPEFCEDLQIWPARRQRSRKRPEEIRRAECIFEYLQLCRRLGAWQNSTETFAHDASLRKRILRIWGSFKRFLVETRATSQEGTVSKLKGQSFHSGGASCDG